MDMPREGEGVFLCTNCRKRITFPDPELGKVKRTIFPGGLLFPKCPECGGRKYERDPRVLY